MANETYTLIQKTTVGSGGAASIEFTSIPQTFTDLVVRSSLRSDQANLYGSSTISLNNSTANFTYRFVYGEGATAASFSGSTNLSADQNGDTATANTFSNFDMYIPNYTSSNYKSISQDSVTENNGTTAYAELGALLWSNTAAITSIKLSPASTKVWKQYSSVSLYGVAKQGVNPVAGPKATGGDIITNDGTYWIHQFLNSGTFIPSQTLSCGYLVVAGGGGGGGEIGGGGGAGGLRSTVTTTGGGGTLESALSVTAQSYAITVGAGGAGTSSATPKGSNGGDSIFSTITSTGGGGGCSNGSATQTGLSGGSGGGGDNANGTGGAGTANQGFAGSGGSSNGAGAGGGAGAAGVASSTSCGGVGGVGVAVAITGSSTYYAGGGGGAGYLASGGAGGNGGGGAGGNYDTVNGTSGTSNTGGGGGGNRLSGTTANGGSGIVIIRYAI